MDALRVRRGLERLTTRLPGVRLRFWVVLEKSLIRSGHSATATEVCELTEATQADAEALLEINPALSHAAVLQRFHAGNRCFLAKHAGAPAFYAWVLGNSSPEILQVKRCTDMHVDFGLAPRWCYYWDVFTHAALRRRGIQYACTAEISRRLAQEDYTGIAVLVSAGNKPSLNAFAKNGFHTCAVLTHLRLMGIDLYRGRYSAKGPAPSG